MISDIWHQTDTEQSSCSEVVRKLQLDDRDEYGDVRYNFIFGAGDLIFQGRSFDYSGAASKFNKLFNSMIFHRLLFQPAST